MAETIRDVVVKIRLAVEKSDELRRAVEQSMGRQVQAEQVRGVREVQEAKKRSAAEDSKRIQAQIQEVRAEADKEAKIAVELDRKLESIENARAARRAQKEAQAGKGGAAGAAGPEAKGFLAGGAENKFLAITGAVITVANAPKVVLGNISQIIRDVRSGEFAKPAEELFGEIGGASRDIRGNMGRGVQAFLDTLSFGLLSYGEKQLGIQQRKALGGGGGILRDGQNARLTQQQRADMGFEALQKQVSAQRELNSILLERTAAEREILAETKKRIDFAKEEFGLLDARKKADVLAMAQKIGRGGIGGLTPEDLEFARGNQAFRGILSEQAKAQADASGFGEVLKALGLDKKVAEGEAKIQAELKQFNQINLNPEKLAKQLEEQLDPLLKQMQVQMEQRLRIEIDRQNKARQNMQGVGL
jgi:hypothetical protein